MNIQKLDVQSNVYYNNYHVINYVVGIFNFIGYVFHGFDAFWVSENPKDIMEFGRLREKYRKKLVASLKDNTTVLSAKFQHDTS